MIQKKKRKFFIYIDESGQDTKGELFVVTALILEDNREVILERLKEIEKDSKKKNIKWSKSYSKFRKKYIERITELTCFKNTLFFEIFNGKEYLKFTSYIIAKTIKTNRYSNDKITIYIDGFNKKELEKLKVELKALQVKHKKLRGVKKDENNAFIRLSDAICGLVRQVYKENKWAKSMLEKLKAKKIITEL
jgi:hypothetical protein